MHSASKYGCLFELEERVGTGVFTNQAYASNRNRSKTLYKTNVFFFFCSIELFIMLDRLHFLVCVKVYIVRTKLRIDDLLFTVQAVVAG